MKDTHNMWVSFIVDADSLSTMQIRNYTGFWNIERKFYSFQDVQLPFPIPIRMIAVFAMAAVVWFPIMFILHVPFAQAGLGPVLWIGVPVGFAYVSGKPWFEGKTLIENLYSRITYLLQNRRYKRLEPDLNKYDTTITVEQNIIVKTPLKPSPFNNN